MSDRCWQILVIDDNPIFIKLLSHMLAKTHPDMEILAAENGRVGYAMTVENKPDVVITDLVMGDWSGHEYVRAVRTDDRVARTPIIVASSSIKIDPELEQFNVISLTKPIRHEELLEAIDIVRLQNFPDA